MFLASVERKVPVELTAAGIEEGDEAASYAVLEGSCILPRTLGDIRRDGFSLFDPARPVVPRECDSLAFRSGVGLVPRKPGIIAASSNADPIHIGLFFPLPGANHSSRANGEQHLSEKFSFVRREKRGAGKKKLVIANSEGRGRRREENWVAEGSKLR